MQTPSKPIISDEKSGITPITGQKTAVGKEYTYILTTQEQRKAIDLTKHKSKLDKIIKGFLGERLLTISFTKENYTLSIADEFTIGDKRRLGRLISEGSDLQKFVKKVIYNGNKDTSGQLFKLKKPSSVEVTDEKVQSK